MATKKSSFSTPEKVFQVCKSMQDAENRRATDRAKIDRLFNGKRPWTPEEEKKYQIQINVNWNEGKRIMRDANGQLNNALLHPGLLFNCTLEEGRVDKRDEWSMIFTSNIHKPLQRGKSGKIWNFTIQSRNASICMHGIGVLHWPNGFRWQARFTPIEDLLIPTGTYCDLTNLRNFAINMYLTPGEFMDMTQGDKVVGGWNQKIVKAILDANRNIFTESTPSTWKDQPEAMEQAIHENKGLYYSDAVPKIKLRAFYWKEVDEPKKWYKHVVLRESMDRVDIDQFVYDGSGNSSLF